MACHQILSSQTLMESSESVSGKRYGFPPISSDSQTLMGSSESVSGKRDGFPLISSDSQTLMENQLYPIF